MKSIPKFLQDLARFAPAMSGGQLLRSYFDDDAYALDDALRDARAKGLVEVSVELIRSRQTIESIAVIRPGELSLGVAEQAAYAASKRWSDTFNPTIIVRATAALACLCGGERRAIATGHLSHELALTDVFLRKRLADPSFEWTLVSQTGPRDGGRVDAVSGTAMIELVGRYNGASVAAKIQLAGSATLELW